MRQRVEKVLAAITPASQSIVKPATSKLQVAEQAVSRKISLFGHALLAFLFLGGILGYSIYILIVFFTRPEVESFQMVPAADFGPQPIDIYTECTNRPNCGIITVAQNYSDASASTGGCYPSMTSTAFAANVAQGNVAQRLTLCPIVVDDVFSVATTAYLGVQGAQVDFAAINPGEVKATGVADPSLKASATVLIRNVLTASAAPGTPFSLNRIINVDTWQVKTLVLSLFVSRVDGVVQSVRLIPSTVQYEGKRPNWRATLMIRLNPLATVSDKSRPGTIVDALASIGGAVTVIGAIMMLLIPICSVVFPGDTIEADDFQAAAPEKGSSEMVTSSSAHTSEPHIVAHETPA